MAKRPHRPSRGARSLSREFALLGIYEHLVNGSSAATIDNTLLGILSEDGEPVAGTSIDVNDFERCDKGHFSTLLQGVIGNIEELENLYAAHVDREVSRLSLVERSILLLATFELQHHLDIPYRVVINEAVELSKVFVGSEGFRYVNGVLDKVAAEVRPAEVAAKLAAKSK